MTSAFNQDNPDLLNADILTANDDTLKYPNSIDITNLPDGTVGSGDLFLGLDASNGNAFSAILASPLSGGSNFQLVQTADVTTPVAEVIFNLNDSDPSIVKYVLIVESATFDFNDSFEIDFRFAGQGFSSLAYDVTTSAYNVNLTTRFDYTSSPFPYLAGDITAGEISNAYIEIYRGSNLDRVHYDSTFQTKDNAGNSVIYRTFGFGVTTPGVANGLKILGVANNLTGKFQLFKVTS